MKNINFKKNSQKLIKLRKSTNLIKKMIIGVT